MSGIGCVFNVVDCFFLQFNLIFDFNCFRNKTTDIPSPPGYNLAVGHSHSEVAKDTDQNHLILKKSWDLALGPIKQVI